MRHGRSSVVAVRRAHADEFLRPGRSASAVGRASPARCGPLDQQDAVGQRLDEVEVLLDQQDGQAARCAQRREALDDLLDDRGLDALGRLVQQDQPRARRTRQRASASSCCSPPDERAAGAVEQSAAAAGSRRGPPRSRLGAAVGDDGAMRRLSRTERPGRSRGPAARSRGRAGRARAAAARAMSAPSKRMRPAVAGSSPIRVLQQRRLAHAVMAEDADELARGDRRGRRRRSTGCGHSRHRSAGHAPACRRQPAAPGRPR